MWLCLARHAMSSDVTDHRLPHPSARALTASSPSSINKMYDKHASPLQLFLMLPGASPQEVT